MAGKSRVKLELDGEKTLREVIEIVVKKIPETKRVLIDPELGDPRPNTLVIVNEREISVLNGLDTVLKNGDEVVFVPVSHGG
jgi:molybdopterin synthase sulfur carrier subunit